MKAITFFLCFLFLMYTSQLLQAQTGWFSQSSGTSSTLYSVHFENHSTGWAVGSGGVLLKTTNGGENWFSQPQGISSSLNSVCFVNVNTGWIAGINGGIGKTTNGGLNWIQEAAGGSYTFNSICLGDAITGCAVGSGILSVYNGIQSWIPLIIDPFQFFKFVYFFNNSTGWLTGFNNSNSAASMHKTTNGGQSWNPQVLPANYQMNSVSFVNGSTGWAAGFNGKIIYTTNGGNVWLQQTSGTTEMLNSIFFADVNTGWVAGMTGKIFKTADGGDNWYLQNTGFITGFYCIWFADNNTGWAVGQSGKILKTTDGGGPIGIEPVSKNIPDKFYLHRNYPNPFNPVTQIGFDIPKTSFVKLAVYDAGGREIAVIVNEQLRAGKYKVSWNALDFPSGVYFCKMKTDEYNGTGKMVLLK